MEHPESASAARFSHSSSELMAGITTTLKVLGIAAGYAAFVWFTMYQLEHGFSALRPFSPGTEIGAGSDRPSIAGKSDANADAPSASPESEREPAAVR